MKIAKLHLLPALLLIATVRLEFVASQLSWNQFETLKGQISSSSCPPIATDTTSYTTTPENVTVTATDPSTSTYTGTPTTTYTDTPGTSTLSRALNSDADSVPVNSIGRNAELNAVNNTDIARNRQTIRIQRRPPRRRSQRRRRRQNRRRPSAQKRRRGNRRSSKDRRRRRRGGQRGGQRRGQRKGVRRVYVRRRNSNRRISDQRN